MVKRTRAQSKTDDLAFPIRVKFIVPECGLGQAYDRIHLWLREEIGALNYADHAASTLAGNGFALHFRQIEDAARCIDAFPDIALADFVDSEIYTSPVKSGQSALKPD